MIGKETNKLNSIESLRINNLISCDGETITNTFNEFFASVGPNLAKEQQCSTLDLKTYLQGLKLHSNSIFLTPTTKEEILGLLKGLPNKTSSGYDNINNLLLKHLSSSIVVPLEIIFNKSIEEGTFPENMKKADIVPLHKSKDRQDCTNYIYALDWFRSYLSNRQIRTKCLIESSGKIELSHYKPINFGAPQGSCLGPLLFLIFTNDLHQQLHHCSSILFADDTTLYKSHRNLVYLQWCIQDE